MAKYTEDELEKELENQEYKYGFVTNIESDKAPIGLNEDIIRLISFKKNEPEWLLEYRLKAFDYWKQMEEPAWAHVNYPKIDFQNIYYYAAPKPKKELSSLDEVDSELLEMYEKLGISIDEQKKLAGVAVDIVMDSVSVKTTFQDTLAKLGIIFGSFSEAVQNHPELVRKYMGTIVPYTDNYYAALNAAVFT
ncbi:MAG: Fe-S cluster assembly protein SufB, partial [Flavobacteriales bacterium]|nr:Fe-S cluster assembly protein SufB [Flavobacteriales bacterium]